MVPRHPSLINAMDSKSCTLYHQNLRDVYRCTMDAHTTMATHREEPMRTRCPLSILTLGVAVVLFQTTPQPAAAGNKAAALTGQITSEAEGAMEGVVVSAKKDGSSVTVSVISDAQGHYSFPANRLSAGKYSLKIRAIG